MIRHRDGGPRHSGTPGLPSSVPELARTLRRVRTRQGLRLEDVSVRTGLPMAQLEALESGTVDRMPDQVATVKVLRAYAGFLGLSGDQFALTLVELWPTVPSAQPPAVALQGTPDIIPATGVPTGMVPAGVPTTGAPVPGTPTGQVTAVATSLSGAWTTTRAHAAVPGPPMMPGLADTGVTPSVAPYVAGAPHRPRRRAGAPLWLKGVLTLVVLAILVGAAGLIIQEVQPSWLRSLGITHGHNGGPGAGSTGGATTTTSAGSTSTTSTQPGSSGTLQPVSTTSTGATFDIKAPTAAVVVTAVGAPSWVQVTTSGQPTPVFGSILQAGQSQSFPVHQSLVVEIGASAAHLSVTSAGKSLGSYVPTVAPYTLTFNAGS